MPPKREKYEPMTASEYNDRRVRLQEAMLLDLEQSVVRGRKHREDLEPVEDLVIKSLRTALKEGTITTYQACMAHSRFVDALTKQARVDLDRYDRVQGVVGLVPDGSNEEYSSTDDEDEDPAARMEFSREQQQILVDLCKLRRQREQERREATQEDNTAATG